MTQRDQNILTMWKAVKAFLDNNSDAWADTPPYVTAVNELNGHIAAADAAIQGQVPTTEGYTQNKDMLEEAAVSRVVAIARSAKAYALTVNDPVFYAAVNRTRTDLIQLPQNQLEETLRAIVTAAETKSSKLTDYGVAKEAYNDARNAIDAFAAALPGARTVVAEKEAHTESVPGILKAGRLVLARMDNLVHIFDEADPLFVSAYFAARKKVDVGTRHEKPEPPTA